MSWNLLKALPLSCCVSSFEEPISKMSHCGQLALSLCLYMRLVRPWVVIGIVGLVLQLQFEKFSFWNIKKSCDMIYWGIGHVNSIRVMRFANTRHGEITKWFDQNNILSRFLVLNPPTHHLRKWPIKKQHSINN